MQKALSAHYRRLERLYKPAPDQDYERLVTALDNSDEPIHRWFHMKEAYSPHLFARLLKDLRINDKRELAVLDPFTGSGTTLVSALTWGGENDRSVVAEGTEINPFLHLLASAKADALSLVPDDRVELARAVERAAVSALEYLGPISDAPELSAFHDPRFFPPPVLETLLLLRNGIESLGQGLTSNLLRVALAATVEPSSRLRRDGRALRFVPGKTLADPRVAFARAVAQITRDLRIVVADGRAHVSLADGLKVDKITPLRQYDLAIYSPPYPNNIDYTEVYKLESWILGLISDQANFRDQRLKTMRSHPSLAWPARDLDLPLAVGEFVRSLAEPLIQAIPEDRYFSGRRGVVLGYLEDSARLLLGVHTKIKSGGHVVYVVGNSHHGTAQASLTIAADILIAAVAESCGFEVVSIKEARKLRRRGDDHFLRESVVTLRKCQ